jgi:DNA-binding MarR family transcriptional regulator
MNLVVSALERRGLVKRRPDPRHRRVLRTSVEGGERLRSEPEHNSSR